LFRFIYKKSFWTVFLTILLLLVVVKLSFNNRQEITFLEKIIHESYAPLQSGVDKLKHSVNSMSAGLAAKKGLEERIRILQNDNNRLNLENQELRENRAEVERLRILLTFKEINQGQYVTEAARVIARSPNNWYKTITIDKGMDSGITRDMPVISPDGLVGKVISASANSAQVCLLTDREMAVGAILQQTRETRGIVEGMGDSDTLRMINIPYYSQVKIGENVVTSGLSTIYPPGIQIGVIKDIKRESNGLVLSATVTPAVDFNRMEEVLVIKKFQAVEAKVNKGV